MQLGLGNTAEQRGLYRQSTHANHIEADEVEVRTLKFADGSSTTTATTQAYGSYYLATEMVNVVNNLPTTYYRVGGTSSFTEQAVSHSNTLSNSNGHIITIPVTGTYKIEGTIVAQIQDSQGSFIWEGRIMRNSGETDTEIAHCHTEFSDYPNDGITNGARTYRHSMDIQTMVGLSQNDTLRLELRQSGGNRVIYFGNSSGSNCRINLFKVD